MSENDRCPAQQGFLDRLNLAGTMGRARSLGVKYDPLRTLAAPAQPVSGRLSRPAKGEKHLTSHFVIKYFGELGSLVKINKKVYKDR